ncbi:hypothetical protein K443DRAFT_102494 [Laccaria amethystina LaAM-08-1]|uniref:Uncharacterized protein n=1 Tax=Laccaria amethystina LaAM-08-1 TaxID=1095629 RepID=A0A0C9XCK6_9AGAR|nr:hypothetical protein K443DRAFT_102494 [Laccaria amethystina LaAM-08-1]
MCKLDVVDALIVLHFVILIINVFRMHIGFITLQVPTIMEVPLSQLVVTNWALSQVPLFPSFDRFQMGNGLAWTTKTTLGHLWRL